MTETRGGAFAYRLDGVGGGQQVGGDGAAGIAPGAPQDGLLWLQLDHQVPAARQWLAEESGVAEVVAEALLADETRPRSVPIGDGLLVILRGVNLNAGSEPEDMVSVRMWIEEQRIITLRHRPVRAIQEVRESLEAGQGPATAGDFLVEISDRLLTLMAPVLGEIDDQVDALEDEVLTVGSYELRGKIGSLRRDAIAMRRYLAPQRDAMARLLTERVSWLGDLHRMQLRELADRVTRYVEDLDSARDRAAVTQDELNSRIAEQMNKTMYVLSIVAGIFLPLGLLTGLLGINVGGIPGTENPVAFTIVCALLLAVAVIQVWIFRRFKWI
ncbi:MAG: zinc transporter ZntB [Nitrospirota bacterium]|jgi:zinc transporter